jgi:serine/threonine-protein kinase
MRSHYTSGAELGPYELLLPLSQVGAAEVWVARLIGAGQFRAHVVLKAIPRACFEDVPTEHLLLEQSAHAARVHHRNLVEVLDLGEQGDTLYVATEWVDSVPLRVVLSEASKAGGVPLPIAINMVAQLCRGLHAIHELCDDEGVPIDAVHGHVSPRNLLVGYNGVVKLCDFGIARVMDRLSFLTAASEHNHKLTFAAPEHLNGGPIDRRSDVFSVGTLLYLLTTSRHPFEGADVRTTLHNICSSQPALPPDTVVPGYPEALGEVVAMALRKAPRGRFGSAQELLDALEATMPECFHAGHEQALAAYVQELCGAHRAELHARMHATQLKHERTRSMRPSAAPVGGESLRAVTLDPAIDAPRDRLSSMPTVPLGPRVQSRSRRAAPLLLAAPAALAVSFLLWRGLDSPSERGPSPALARDGASMPEMGVRSLPVSEVVDPATSPPHAPPEPDPALTPSSKVPSEVTPAALPITPLEALPPARAPAARFAPGVARNPASTPSIATPQPSATPTAVPAREASSRNNPWDPSTFGGRY